MEEKEGGKIKIDPVTALFQCQDEGVCAFIVHLCKTEYKYALIAELDTFTLVINRDYAESIAERARGFMRKGNGEEEEKEDVNSKKKKKKTDG